MPAVTLIYVSFDKPLKNPKGVKTVYHPLGVSYLSGFLKSHDIGSRVYNHHFENQLGTNSFEANLHKILKKSGEWVGFSCMSSSLPPLLLFLEKFRNKYSKKKFILGGSAVSNFPKRLMQRFPYIDFIIKGEGEYPLLRLLKGEPCLSIGGLVYREKGKICVNEVDIRLADLDFLPYPDYSFFDYEKLFHEDVNFDGFYILTGRGCAYKCSFCDIHSLWGNKTVMRSIEDVIQEIKSIVEQTGYKAFKIIDDNFLLDSNRVVEFCRRLKKEKLEIYWGCSSNIRDIDEELMKTLKESNCLKIFFGVESSSDEILRKIEKRYTYREAKEKIICARNYFPVVTSSFIWGFPFETYDEFKNLEAEVRDLRASGIKVQTHLLNPMPGTKIFDEYGSCLRFKKGVQSDIIGWPVWRDAEALNTFIEDNIDLFPAFCHYETDCFDEKFKTMSRIVAIKF